MTLECGFERRRFRRQPDGMKQGDGTGGRGDGAERFQVVFGRIRRQADDGRDPVATAPADDMADGNAGFTCFVPLGRKRGDLDENAGATSAPKRGRNIVW